MENHVVLATLGFVGFVWFALIAMAVQSMAKTRNESSLLQGRRRIAEKFGWETWENAQQHPATLWAQVWLTRALTLAAFCFTCWHLANAVFE